MLWTTVVDLAAGCDFVPVSIYIIGKGLGNKRASCDVGCLISLSSAYV